MSRIDATNATEDAAGSAASTDAPVIYVCSTCRRAAEPDSFLPPGAILAAATMRAAAGMDVDVRHIRCLANCNRGLSAALLCKGSWTYVFGGLDESCGSALVEGARLLATSADGFLPWRGRLEPLKRGLIARVPPISFEGFDR